jgi:hypothetical protein
VPNLRWHHPAHGRIATAHEDIPVSEQIALEPEDRIEIITLYEKLVDQTAPGGSVVERLRPKAGDNIVSTQLAEERRSPLTFLFYEFGLYSCDFSGYPI